MTTGRVAVKGAIVTGASGMGRTGAARLAREGASVVVADVGEHRAQAIVAQVEAIADAVQNYGRTDIVYHNAVDPKFVNEQDRRPTELPDGRSEERSMTVTATVNALVAYAGLDSHTAAIGGIVALTRSLAAGLARDGVRRPSDRALHVVSRER